MLIEPMNPEQQRKFMELHVQEARNNQQQVNREHAALLRERKGGYASTVVIPGVYWLGDPCYNIPNADWGKWLDACEEEQSDGVPKMLLRGHLDVTRWAVAAGTYYG